MRMLANSPTPEVVPPKIWTTLVITRLMAAITGPREKPRIRRGVKEKSSFSQGAKKARGISGK